MTDLAPILALWKSLRDSRAEYVLATVVKVEGSGYRRPGARMLIAADGRRAGTISGGCLEGEVARKAFWHTQNGPVVRRYSTSAEDGDVPFGMGCGGVVHLLLERSATAETILRRLAGYFSDRQPLAVATVLDGESVGKHAFWPAENAEDTASDKDEIEEALEELARQSFEERHSASHSIYALDGEIVTVGVEWNAARPGLHVFGAGDDAIPLVRQASQLGWYVSLADGRSNLATRVRFPEADDIRVSSAEDHITPDIRTTDAAVVMTHSLEQDTACLRRLLGAELRYIGVLGPQRRTNEILTSLAYEFEFDELRAKAHVSNWMDRIHAPMGLDLGGETPADIALAVVAEIQRCIHAGSGLSLREIRAANSGRRTAVQSSR